MKKLILALPLSFVSMISYGSFGFFDNVVLYYSGPAKKNTRALPQIFEKTCRHSSTGVCTPSTTVPMTNAVTGRLFGKINVWTTDGKESVDGRTRCFTELIEYKLIGGNIYTVGKTNGTCGAFADPTLIRVPSSGPRDPIVIVGGGSGKIVGATNFYFYLMDGSYVARTYVGLNDSFEIKNYSGLYFKLTPKFRNISDKPELNKQ